MCGALFVSSVVSESSSGVPRHDCNSQPASEIADHSNNHAIGEIGCDSRWSARSSSGIPPTSVKSAPSILVSAAAHDKGSHVPSTRPTSAPPAADAVRNVRTCGLSSCQRVSAHETSGRIADGARSTSESCAARSSMPLAACAPPRTNRRAWACAMRAGDWY